MRLDITALLNSDFDSGTDDDLAWRCAVTLWMRAWHQVPAGSLPEDDRKLCKLAGLGRDIDVWNRVKNVALHRFYKCSDGRLYHDFLADQVNAVWSEKRNKDKEKAADRERKRRNSEGNPAEIQRKSGHREGEGEQKELDSSLRSESPELLPINKPSSDPDQIRAAVEHYNDAAQRAGLPVAQNINDSRRAKIRARLKECGGLDGWLIALQKMEASSFCCGGSSTGWRMNLDSLVQAQTFTKLMEGAYDNPSGADGRRGVASTSGAFATVHKWAEQRDAEMPATEAPASVDFGDFLRKESGS
jgi:hypothetical protein